MGWTNVVQVGVVDCADDLNTELCRQQDIIMYPSIKNFWINVDISKASDKNSVGSPFEGETRSLKLIRTGLIDFLVKSWHLGAPRQWPDLMPYSALSKSQFMKMLPFKENKPIFIIVENENSYVGREVSDAFK